MAKKNKPEAATVPVEAVREIAEQAQADQTQHDTSSQEQQPQQGQQTAQKPTQQPQQDFVKLNMGYLYQNGSKMLNDLPQGMDRFDFMAAKKELYGYLQNWRDSQKQPTTKLSPEATALYNTIQRLTNDLPQNQKTELLKKGGEMNQVPG